MLLGDVFERHGIRPVGILHVGANECQERDLYARSAGVGDDGVLWVEAIPALVSAVSERLPGVRIVQAVVSDADDVPVTFRVTNNGAQSSSFLPLGLHRTEHPDVREVQELVLTTTTLPTLLARVEAASGGRPARCDFLAMDIQGAELHALRGAEAVLDRFRWVYLEVNTAPVYEGCGLLEEVEAFLERRGFRLVEVCVTRHGWGDALFERDRPVRPACALEMHASSGLGDRLLDAIGFAVASEVLGSVGARGPEVLWDVGQARRDRADYPSSGFDLRTLPWRCLEDPPATPRRPGSFLPAESGLSFCPASVAAMLDLPQDPQLVRRYVEAAQKVRPSAGVAARIPADVGEAVGVHLRRGDKLTQTRDNASAFEASTNESNRTMVALQAHVARECPPRTKFYVCSDDPAFRAVFCNILRVAGYVVLEPRHAEADADADADADAASADLVDFFALSRCREVLQGIKYSTFSLAAAIVGGKPLRNFSDFGRTRNLLNYWAPLLVNMPADYDWSDNPYRSEMDAKFVLPSLEKTKRGLGIGASSSSS